MAAEDICDPVGNLRAQSQISRTTCEERTDNELSGSDLSTGSNWHDDDAHVSFYRAIRVPPHEVCANYIRRNGTYPFSEGLAGGLNHDVFQNALNVGKIYWVRLLWNDSQPAQNHAFRLR